VHCDHIQVVTACTLCKLSTPMLLREKPPIPFVIKAKKVDAEGADSDRFKHI
jgi:hypothetical protein